MITYKPSSRLGALNEENFTSDPTTRSWTVTGTGYTFTAAGATVTEDGSAGAKSVTLELNNTKLQQYISFSLSGNTGHRDLLNMAWELYFDDVKIAERASAAVGAGQEVKATFTLFKSTPNKWVQNYLFEYSDTDNRVFSTSTYTDIDANSNSVGKIKVYILVDGNVNNIGDLSLTNLKWV